MPGLPLRVINGEAAGEVTPHTDRAGLEQMNIQHIEIQQPHSHHFHSWKVKLCDQDENFYLLPSDGDPSNIRRVLMISMTSCSQIIHCSRLERITLICGSTEKSREWINKCFHRHQWFIWLTRSIFDGKLEPKPGGIIGTDRVDVMHEMSPEAGHL